MNWATKALFFFFLLWFGRQHFQKNDEVISENPENSEILEEVEEKDYSGCTKYLNISDDGRSREEIFQDRGADLTAHCAKFDQKTDRNGYFYYTKIEPI